MLTFLRQFKRTMNAAGHVGRAEKLERRGRLAAARVAFLDCLRAADPSGPDFLQPAIHSSRLVATMGLARVAAALNDRPEAVQYARAGLALWSEARLEVPAMRQLKNFESWESWARAYLEYAATVPAARDGIIVEFIPDGARNAPLILLRGHDREAIRALRRAFAGIGRGALAVHAVEGISPIGGCHLVAAVGERDQGVRQLGDLTFEWVMDAEGWAQVDGLLEPFDDPSATAGFQFLSQQGEVAVMISPDGRW